MQLRLDAKNLVQAVFLTYTDYEDNYENGRKKSGYFGSNNCACFKGIRF
jgi:hypothetical protein